MKITNFPRIIAAVLLTALVGAIVSIPPAMATGEAISLRNSQGSGISQGSIGQTVNIAGSGFTGNTTPTYGLNILFGRQPILTSGGAMDYANSVFQVVQVAPLNTDGTFTNSFTVPTTLAGSNAQENVTRGQYYVYVTYYYPPVTPGGSSSNGTTVLQIAPFYVVIGAITISPTSAAVGDSININGTYFGAAEGYTITYDSTVLNISGTTAADGSFTAKITVPPGTSGQHTIIVSGNNSGTTAQATFTVNPHLTVVPPSGAAGTLINVLGTGFGVQSNLAASFGGDPLTPVQSDVFGSFAFTLGAPKKPAGTYTISVTDGSVNSANGSFTLTTTSLSVTPTTGLAGTPVKVTGSNFLPNHPVTVTFNDVNVDSATSDAQGAVSANFAVPAIATGTYKVKVSDGTNTNSADFTIPATAAISPVTSADSPGHVGQQLTVTGAGFTPSGIASITYDGNQIATSPIKADGTFSQAITVPASAAGAHTIAATDGVNSPPAFTFVMDSTPPAIPVPLKPEMGLKAAARTIFNWQDVVANSKGLPELNGVTYELQVASDQGFSPSHILVEKKGLTTSIYTLTADEKLAPTPKETPYYWHVRAIDGAGNQSDWSGTGSFYIANIFSLSQTAIYILIGIGAVLLAVFGFWLGRRTAYY